MVLPSCCARRRELIPDISSDDIDTLFQTNVIGLIYLTQIFVREFKARDTGVSDGVA